MAVMVQLDAPGMEIAQYEAMHTEIMKAPPAGLVLHVTALMEGGLRIVELWESEAHFFGFVEHRLRPMSAASGAPEPENVLVLPVHRMDPALGA
jgi:hypothetical protein